MDQCRDFRWKAALRLAMQIVALLPILHATQPLSAGAGPAPKWALPATVSLDQVEHWEMPWVDLEALRADDARRETSGIPVAPRFAKIIPVSFSPHNSGTWETLEDGTRVWRLRISSAGAHNLSLGLKDFDLPSEAKFWIHASDGSGVQGPYTRESRNALGGLWTAVVLGDEIVVELHLPKGASADLFIESVNHGYRLFGERESEEDLKRGSCNINVVCPSGDAWRDQIRSVAKITTNDGSYLYSCTATLVNNTADDLTPYLLTADHCIEEESRATTLTAYWNYQSPECDDFSGGSLSQNQSGATLLAHLSYDFGSDFALLELDQQPQASFKVYYSGWDVRDQTPASSVTIHHPDGDEKSFSSDCDPPTITSLMSSVSPGDGQYFRIGAWDEGTTEGGSSGCCLFDSSTNRCIGTLTGGYASCTAPNEPDWYGRMHAHWTGGGTDDTRLSNWLDPGNTGTLYLDGFDPSIFADGFESGDTTVWSTTAP
jgi:hypothetical protein